MPAMNIKSEPTLGLPFTKAAPTIPSTEASSAEKPKPIIESESLASKAEPTPPMNIARIAANIPNMPPTSPSTNEAVLVLIPP